MNAPAEAFRFQALAKEIAADAPPNIGSGMVQGGSHPP